LFLLVKLVSSGTKLICFRKQSVGVAHECASLVLKRGGSLA
jgi:hypothetical protein